MSNEFTKYKTYGILADFSYLNDENQEKNLKKITNYKFEKSFSNFLTGFEVAVYSNGNEKVIAFRGTDRFSNRPFNAIKTG